MTYSSALFNSSKGFLEKAQENKYKNILKNFNLKTRPYIRNWMWMGWIYGICN